MREMTEEWLLSARDDLDTIQAIKDNPRLTNVAAFHAQQCIEKCFKAILEEHEINVPNIHNLVTLQDRVEDLFELPVDIQMLDRLNQLYIEARYPGEFGLLPEGKPSTQEAEQFHQFAERLYRDVSGALERDA